MDWKTWKNEKTFIQSGKSKEILNRLEKSGNFTQNIGKMREFYPNYWKSEQDLASFYFFSDFLMQVYLLDFCAS